jgi:simple sugar transport system ATP-binding protein
MRTLKATGKSIVFITHKLKEVKAIADRITVVRRGRVVGTARPDASEDELAALMVGRTVKLRVDKGPADPGGPVLAVRGLVVHDERGHRAVDGADLEVRAGEVLGVAGVQGNGQTELVEAVMGLRPVTAGRIELSGRDLTGRSTKQILRAGVGYIPEDRSVDGLVRAFTVAENLILDRYDQPPYARGLALRPAAIEQAARDLIAEFDVRTSGPDVPVGTLSGGNQQKVIVARELGRPSAAAAGVGRGEHGQRSQSLKLFVAAQPTRGVDVGSTEFIHARVVRERDSGAGVLLVSSELDEILALADRIVVMYRGRILATVDPDTPREQIGLLMAGVTS